MYWGIYDDYTIRMLRPKGKKAILIRALEPSYKERGIPYKIYALNQYIDVLELYFDDIWEIVSNEVYDRYRLFNEDMAKELISFIKKNDFDEVNVHCGAGISRSSALMICISKIIDMPQIEKEIINSNRFIPNKLVLSVFDKVFNGDTLDIKEKEIINTNKELWSRETTTCDIKENEDGSFSIILK